MSIECYFDICPYHSTNLYVDEEGPFCDEEDCHVPEYMHRSLGDTQYLIAQFKKEIHERNNV
jgi:hypothetical protein